MHSPERTCIGCRRVCAARELVRLIAPDGQVQIAPRRKDEGKKWGRGAWVHPGCITSALKSGAMSRAFRRQVVASDANTLLAQMHSAYGQSLNGQGIDDDWKRL
jgi:uncharacterized protein